MITDFGHRGPLVTHFRARRARAHLFAFQIRHLVVAGALVMGLALGFGFLTERAHSATTPPAAPGFVWVTSR
jgi:hypothetical protein